MPTATLGIPAPRSLPLHFRTPILSTKSTKSSSDDRRSSESTRKSTDRRPSAMDIFASKDKRKSLNWSGGRSSSPAKSSPKNSPKVGPAKPAKIAVDMESPPLVFYGTPASSSGALLSGQLLLTVTDPDITLQSFTMRLVAISATRKPVVKDCSDCLAKTATLFSWKFLTEPKTFTHGTHQFPFSYLLPGHLPATCHGELGSVDYMLDVSATTTLADHITVSRMLTVQRALMPGMDKNSIRIFPPTNLTATVALPSVVHPIGTFPVQMRLTGIVDTSIKDIQRRWRIRKMNWRIDEHSRVVSAACSKHAPRIGGEGKGILHEETRSIGGEDLKGGWKTDFDGDGGQIECEFVAACKANLKPPPICDLESPTGMAIHHNLVLELVVAEEQTQKTGGRIATPTGSARVLRMQFKLILTERAGMGISWDEEQPPMYEDVPRSPPGYTKMEDWTGGDLPPVEEVEGDVLEVSPTERGASGSGSRSRSGGRQR